MATYHGKDRIEIEACMDMLAEGLAGVRRSMIGACDREGLALAQRMADDLPALSAHVRRECERRRARACRAPSAGRGPRSTWGIPRS